MSAAPPDPAARTVAPEGRPRLISSRSTTLFVVLIRTVSLFSEATYDGGRSIVGQFLEIVPSCVFTVGGREGARGPFLGYSIRLYLVVF